MSLSHSPSIVTDELMMYYDQGNKKSWKGAPATNEIVAVTWAGDGATQSSFVPESILITDDNFKYNGLETYLYSPRTSLNGYLNGSDLNFSSTSTDWTFSCYIRREDGANITAMSSYMYFPTTGTGTCTIVPVGNGWHFIYRTISGALNYLGLIGFTGFAANTKYYLSGAMLSKTSYPVYPVATNSARTNTQSIIDLTKNSTITANSLTYNSDGNFSFNGSNNAISIPTITPTSGVTFNAWIYIDGANANYGAIFSNWGTGGNAYFINTQNGVSTSIQVYFSGSLRFTITSLPLNTYMMLTITNNGTTAVGYINGIQQASAVSTLISATNISSIGYDISRNNFPFKGIISIAQIYNRFLSSDEIQQNFQSLRGRYGV